MNAEAEELAGRVLALDFGAVRTGVAMTDPSRLLAAPYDIIDRAATSDGMATIADLVARFDVVHVVVGLPAGLQGDTAQTLQTRSFAGRLRAQLTPVTVELWDERFTSLMADRTRHATGSTTPRDSLAACHLLESWMEAHAR